MLILARIIIIIASVQVGLATKSAIFFAAPVVFECAVQFYRGYKSA